MIHTHPLSLLSLHESPPRSCCTCLFSLYLYPVREPQSLTALLHEGVVVLCPRTGYRILQTREDKFLAYICLFHHPQMARSRK